MEANVFHIFAWNHPDDGNAKTLGKRGRRICQEPKKYGETGYEYVEIKRKIF
jgi:hypothetical protein